MLNQINFNRLRFVLWILSCGYCQYVQAQNPDILSGYIIFAKGDSMEGQINFNGLRNNAIRFKPEGQDAWQKLRPSDLKRAVSVPDYYVVPKELENKDGQEAIFIQKISGNGYELFQGKSQQAGKVFFFGSAKNGKLVRLNPLGLETQMKVLTGDCGGKIEFKNVRFTNSSLQQLVSKLNTCAYPNEKPFRYEDKLQIRWAIGLNVFYYHIQPKMAGGSYFAGDYHAINKASLGLSLKMDLNPFIGFYTGINFVDKRMSTDTMQKILYYEFQRPGQRDLTYDYFRYKVDLNTKYLEIPLGFLYTPWPYGKISPYLNFGFTIQRPIVAKMESEWGYPICPAGDICHLPPGEEGHIYATNVIIYKEYLVNFFGGVGLKKTFAKRHEFSLGITYFNQKEHSRVSLFTIQPSFSSLKVKTARTQLSVGYHYFLNAGK